MKKVTKKPMNKQMAFMLDEKLELKIKRIMKKLKLKSLSETIRACIEAYS